MAANNIRLVPGTYLAKSEICLSLMHQSEQKEYQVVKTGEQFVVPHHANNYWHAATYYPDFGDESPEFELIKKA
jgi:hypothetical protein